MHTHVRQPRIRFTFRCKSRRSGFDALHRYRVGRGCSRTHERDRKLVLTWITGLETYQVVRSELRFRAMRMRGRSVVMLWMVVIGGCVDVQPRDDPRRHHKRPYEQQCQHQAHDLSL